MAIKRDHSNLPAAKAVPAPTHPPDQDPWLVRQLMTQVVEQFNRPYAPALPELPFRFSDAASCSRKLAYTMAGVEESDPPDVPSLWVMGMGQVIGDYLQRAALEVYPGAEIETTIDGRPMGLPGSGHTDITMTKVDAVDPLRISVELKTIGGFGYKMAATTFKGGPQGPRRSAIVQGALNAKGWDADLLIVVNIATEAVGKNLVAGIAGDADAEWLRIGAQWTYTREEYEPIAQAEIERINRILGKVERAESIPRFIPLDDGTPVEINNPATGAYTKRNAEGVITAAGTTWQCGYCRYQTRCSSEPEFIVPKEDTPS